MNTLDLLSCLRKLSKKIFEVGVFPCDKLPTSVRKPALIIANTDSSNKPGSHWVAFYIPKYGVPEFFDSYGQKPNKYFENFLHQQATFYKYNKQRLQSDFSSLCGNYCCVYLYFKSLKMPTHLFLKKFERDNYIINDRRILKLFNNIYKKNKRRQSGGGKIKLNCSQTCRPLKYKTAGFK